MSQVDEGMIHAWLDGALSADDAARVETLVRTDATWGAAAAEARGLIANAARLVRALDDGVTSGGGRRSVPDAPPTLGVVRGEADRVLRLGRRIGAIAAVLVVAVVGRLAWTTSHEVEETVAEVARETRVPEVRVPAEPQATGDQAATIDETLSPLPLPTVAAAPAPARAEAPASVATAVPAVAPAAPAAAAPLIDAAVAGSEMNAVAGKAMRAMAREAVEAPSLAWLENGACVRVIVLWPAEGDLPSANAEVIADRPAVRRDGDTLRLEAPLPSQRADGTPVATRARLALHRRDGRGVAELVRPDGSVARRGVVEQARRCP